MYKMSHRTRPPKPSEEQPATVDDIVLKQLEQDKQEKNDRLLNELMLLKFRIKMCSDLYKVNMKGTSILKKKLMSVYLKKLKKYCELNNGIFDTDLIKQELNLELDDLTEKLKKISLPLIVNAIGL